jgi:hypothetical protein
MSKLHLTTKPRKAFKTVDGVSVPSINLQGKQDIQIAGTVASLEANERFNDKTGKSYYRGVVKILLKGREEEVSCIFTGGEDKDGNARIANIDKDATYWVTVRKSEDGMRTNFNCGGLRVVNEVSTDDFDSLYDSLISDEDEPIEAEKPVATTNRKAKLVEAEEGEE